MCILNLSSILLLWPLPHSLPRSDFLVDDWVYFHLTSYEVLTPVWFCSLRAKIPPGVSGEVQLPLQTPQPASLASSGHRDGSQQGHHLQNGGKLSHGTALSTVRVCGYLWKLTPAARVVYLLPLPKADCDPFFPICALNSPRVAS